MKAATPLYDVVTVGAATRDLFVESHAFERHASRTAPDGFSACLPMGSKLDIDTLTAASGGGATNAAVTFARLGYHTATLSRVGLDGAGRDVLEELAHERISIDAVQTDHKQPTAQSIILISGAGSRAILTARGASAHISTADAPWKKLTTRWIYLTSLAGNLKETVAVFKAAEAMGARVAWNPGSHELEHGLTTLRPMLRKTDILIMNREEAAQLAGVAPRLMPLILKKISGIPKLAFVCTDGAEGAIAVTRGGSWKASALKVKATNATGAGDAFGSGFVAAMMHDGDVKEALQVATLNAGSVVSHMGAKAGILKSWPAARTLAAVHVAAQA